MEVGVKCVFLRNEEYSTALGINYSVLNGNTKIDPRMRVINTEVIFTTAYLHCTMRQMQILNWGLGKSDYSCKDSIQLKPLLKRLSSMLAKIIGL